MSVVLAIAGKKYTISSSSVDELLLQKAAAIFDQAAAEIAKRDSSLSEGQLCAMVAMRCIVPLLQEKEDTERALEECLRELRGASPG